MSKPFITPGAGRALRALAAATMALALASGCAGPRPGARAAPAAEDHTPAPVAAWKLVWADEFDGTAVDTAKWTFETGGDGWGNRELEYYTPGRNATLSNGTLVIEARREDAGGRQYTSTRMVTKGKAYWTYGRAEARIRMPHGKGLWPAFWMLGENIDAVGWPKCGEIDIVEMVGGRSADGRVDNDAIASAALHRPDVATANGQPVKSVGAKATLPGGARLADDFHVYAVEWDAKRIRWSVDGRVYLSTDIASRTDGFEAFHRPFFIILNLAVGGNWPGAPDASTVWPQQMVVDWVRVYQR